MSVPADNDLEPKRGPYDWYEAFRQNSDKTEFDWSEAADEAAARLLADQVGEWVSGDPVADPA